MQFDANLTGEKKKENNFILMIKYIWTWVQFVH